MGRAAAPAASSPARCRCRLSAPVPQEFARRFDARAVVHLRRPSGRDRSVHDRERRFRHDGRLRPRAAHPARPQPELERAIDNRPAYLDEIEIRQGNDDATVMSRRILEGENMINGDQPPPPAILRSALAERKGQIQLVPAGGEPWIAMNTTIPPFDDVNVRRAVIAGFDREAMRLTYGGEASGDIPTHFLPPGIQGFNEAGGLEGPGLDFLSQPSRRHRARGRVLPQSGLSVRQVRRRRDVPDGGRERRGRCQRGLGRSSSSSRKLGFRRPPAPAQPPADVQQVLRRPQRQSWRSARTSAG